MKTLVSAILGVALFTAPATAQVEFWASLDGFQETPAISTLGGGWGKFVLDPATSILSYDVHVFGLSSATTGAHIHFGSPGAPGPIEVTLIGGPTDWVGSSLALSPVQIGDLRAGDWYANIHTALHPAGEIRGQLLTSPNEFGAVLDASQEVPPTPPGGTAVASFTLNPNGTLTYSVTATGLTGPITSAHVHGASFGVNGGIDVALTVTSPTTATGSTAPLSTGPLNRLQTLGSYVNLHTAAHPAGEIRGQIVRSGLRYGPNSDPPSDKIRLRSTGAPTNLGGGGAFTIHVENGLAFGSGILLASIAPGAALLNSEPFLLNSGLIIINQTLPLDASGELHLPVLTPGFPASLNLYMQFFGLDSSAPNGKFNVSNGLEFPLTKLP